MVGLLRQVICMLLFMEFLKNWHPEHGKISPCAWFQAFLGFYILLALFCDYQRCQHYILSYTFYIKLSLQKIPPKSRVAVKLQLNSIFCGSFTFIFIIGTFSLPSICCKQHESSSKHLPVKYGLFWWQINHMTITYLKIHIKVTQKFHGCFPTNSGCLLGSSIFEKWP